MIARPYAQPTLAMVGKTKVGKMPQMLLTRMNEKSANRNGTNFLKS